MIRILLISAVCVLTTGCLFVVDSRQRLDKEQWSPAELQRIEAGRTSSEWILRNFGAPDRKVSYEDGTELWRYHNRSTKQSRVGLFLLFKVNVERDATETLVLQLSNGVVTDYWVERR